jgi:hypothetical protein
MTAFQRAVVVLTAAAVVLQLLHPPLYFSRTVGERPDFPATLLRVLALLVAGGVVSWIGWNRMSLALLFGAFLVGWLGTGGWSTWRIARANASMTCGEAHQLAQGTMNWSSDSRLGLPQGWKRVTQQVSLIISPDGSRWAVPSWKTLASARMPRRWEVETFDTPTFIVVLDDKPNPISTLNPPLGKVRSVGLVTREGIDFSPIATLMPLNLQIVRLVREKYPRAYNDLSDSNLGELVQKRMVVVGGPTEQLVHAFCSRTRLWFGW